jgi:hypothetical protein
MSEPTIVKVNQKKSSEHWNPVQGSTFSDLLNANRTLSQGEKDLLSSETLEIMQKCIDPGGQTKQSTGLVIGYVQSGKTLSFTGLAALARDNKYQIVVLLAGTTNNLVEQSFARLKTDLGIDKNRDWKMFSTQQKGFQKGELERVGSELAKWRRGSTRARTILIVSMKQHQHLQNLANLLSDVNLSDVPTLIIDDEGDQAGMNTKALREEESTTYTRINTLREIFPKHSYLLYTATPQAPLLISRIDTLSPDFGSVLTPGESYVGGQEFFVDGQDKYIELIPASDVPDRLDPPHAAPATLLAAMRDFFNGVAIGLFEGADRTGKNRSMMIHPAVPKDEHFMYAQWVKKIKAQWSVILQDENHDGHTALLASFENSFNALLETHSSTIVFDDISKLLFDAIEDTPVVELNTREKSRIPSIDWNSEYSWILVGGIGLDRGFTVEGLTVSYMPRSIGVGNADNIQQRARFFGYKRGFLGLCRIFLTSENIDAFSSYVSHEESVRGSIKRHLEDGKTLKEWRRSYFLDQQLRPTRSSVVLLDMYQSRGRGGWTIPDFPYEDTETLSENRDVFERLLNAFEYQEYAEIGWNDKQAVPQFSASIKLSEIIPFIGQVRYKIPDDNLQHASIMLGLDRLVADYPEMTCNVYALSGPWSGVSAMRTLTEKVPPKIRALFQGSNARTNYPGARALISDQSVTFQIHRYDLQTADKKRVLKDVPILAVHIPDQLTERVWIER